MRSLANRAVRTRPISGGPISAPVVANPGPQCVACDSALTMPRLQAAHLIVLQRNRTGRLPGPLIQTGWADGEDSAGPARIVLGLVWRSRSGW